MYLILLTFLFRERHYPVHFYVYIVSAAPSAKNIGVVFDEVMSLVPHVTNICKTSCCHLHAIRKIRQFLEKDSTILLLHAFVISRLQAEIHH